MTGEEFLRKLREDPKTCNGYYPPLRAWVDEHSAVARVLRALDEENER